MQQYKKYIPNILTILRIALVPLFIYAVITPDFWLRVGALFLFVLASVTDFIDGKLARRWHVQSEFGKFMDPMADKLLVIASLFALLYLEDMIELWMVLVIIGRDFLITGLRYFAIYRGSSLRTSRLGKVKTTFQMLSIMIILMIVAVRTHPESHVLKQQYVQAKTEAKSQGLKSSDLAWQHLVSGQWEKIFLVIPYLLMLFITIFTIISGLRYIYTNYSLFLPQKKKFNSRARRQKKQTKPKPIS